MPLQIDALDAIDAIERRAYPTPWSRAMFTGELTKPSGRCYGAYEDDRLIAYLIVSRYPDAWHVMNLAVDPDHWRKGVGRTLLERLFADTARDLERGITLEVRVSNAAAIRLYRALGFQPHRHPPRLLHGQPRGRPDHVAGSAGRRPAPR